MTRKCLTCAAAGNDMVRFNNETFTIDHAGMTTKVKGLSGWRCDGCDEIEFDPESAHRYAAAGDELVLRNRALRSEEIRRIRRKLGLSQGEAARLTGGGHNAFSRYERGEAVPMPAVLNLLRILDKHPELLAEIQPGASASKPPRKAVAHAAARTTAPRVRSSRIGAAKRPASKPAAKR